MASIVVVAGVALGGCGRNDFEDRTAKVTIDSRTTTYQLASCGLDGSTLFVVGRSDEGAVLQAVVGLDDEQGGVTESSGLTISRPDDDGDLAAFGPESWERRGEAGDPPGEIRRAALRGSRIQLSGRSVPVDGDGVPSANGADVAFTLDARCDDQAA